MPRHPLPPRMKPFARYGGVNMYDLRRYLGVTSGLRMKALVEAAGVELKPYVRNDAVVQNRVYKHGYHPFTPEEAGRIMAVFYQLKGRRFLQSVKLDEASLGELVSGGGD